MADSPKKNQSRNPHKPFSGNTQGENDGGTEGRGETVSLSPLKLRDALKGLMAIPDPDATKPKVEKAKRKRKKAPPTGKG